MVYWRGPNKAETRVYVYVKPYKEIFIKTLLAAGSPQKVCS